jgi:ferrochelatase
MAAERTGLLLINLGTPASPRLSDVRPYLREFLSDPRVLDVSPLLRWFLLNVVILPRRPKQSAAAYEKIWTDRGSPLLFHSRDLVEKVQRRVGSEVMVALAMRYGQPSIASGLEELRDNGVQRIVVFPLYPQYSSAATGSSIEKVFGCASELWNVPSLQFVPPFYDHPAFIEAKAAVARPYVERADYEKVFFSFHGLPERHVRKSDPSGKHCLRNEDCCERIVGANVNCYRAQCFATARLLADSLGVPEDKRILCFQSRLGREPWIRPYTDELVLQQAHAGVKRALIMSPAFVTDCLETIEELGIRAAESFETAGGERLELVPSLNARDDWADALVTIAREHSTWLADTADRSTQDHRSSWTAR